jgi:hypothetical protein
VGDGQAADSPSLTPREQTDLVVFLESLSTFANPWPPEDAGTVPLMLIVTQSNPGSWQPSP